MASNVEELEGLLTCSICFTGYDNNLHKPKFLSCHHIFCLRCLQTMNERNYITCPLCREITVISVFGGTESLKTNPYPLEMFKVLQAQKSMANAPHERRILGPQWCLNCSSMAAPLCLAFTSHKTLAMGSSTRKEALALQEVKAKYDTCLAMAIGKRKENKSHLNSLKNYLQAIEDDVEIEEEENNTRLAELISLLEHHSSGETVQSVLNKLSESSRLLEQEYEAVDSLLQYGNSKTWRVKIEVEDVEGKKRVALVPEVEQGFILNEIQDRSSKGPLSVLTHIISNNFLKLSQTASDAATAHPNPVEQHQSSSGASPLTSTKHFDIRTCVFALKISQNSKTLGQVLVDPNPEFCDLFLASFGNFCCQRKSFSAQIQKAVAGSFITIQFGNPNFQPYIPDASAKLFGSLWSGEKNVETALDLGFENYYSDSTDKITSWDLIFLIRDFNPNNMRPSPKFGRIRAGQEIITALSKKRPQERRNLSATWKVLLENR